MDDFEVNIVRFVFQYDVDAVERPVKVLEQLALDFNKIIHSLLRVKSLPVRAKQNHWSASSVITSRSVID